MNPVVDTIVLILFILLVFYLIRGMNRTIYLRREEDEKTSNDPKE